MIFNNELGRIWKERVVVYMFQLPDRESNL